MSSHVKEAQLRALITAARQQDRDIPIIGIHADQGWTGAEAMEVDGVAHLIRQCPSELAIRTAMVDAAEEACHLVFLTPLDDGALGTDVRCRLPSSRLRHLNNWETVADLFSASRIEPALFPQNWLADLLMEHCPPKGFRPSPSGTVTAEMAYGAFLEHALLFSCSSPEIREILHWCISTDGPRRYRELTAEAQTGVSSYLRNCAGKAGESILRCVQEGHAERVVAIGLAIEVVLADDLISDRRIAGMTRLENFTGGLPIAANAGQDWCHEAMALYREVSADGSTGWLQQTQQHLEQILKEIGLDADAWLSSVSNQGFDQLVDHVGELLINTGSSGVDLRLDSLLERVREHLRSGELSRRVDRVTMAVRLQRWLSNNPPGPPQDLAAIAKRYATDHAYVDWAQNVLLEGDNSVSFADAVNRLLSEVREQRTAWTRAFAEQFAAAIKTNLLPGNGLGLENFVERVVAPIAKKQGVLLIVLDGMSFPVFHELMEDLIRRRQWVQFSSQSLDGPAWAVLPSITQVSRRSLFCGRLTADPADDEAKGFAAHAALQKVCGSSVPPRLFLKNQISVSGSGELSHELREELENAKRKVIGVVINAVDDHLEKSEQLSIPWRIDTIPVLANLVDAAAKTERVVVLVSDHGHVLDRDSTCYAHEDGERYRQVDGTVKEGEIEVHGDRVLQPEPGQMVGAWMESLRYTKRKKNGYHGGISPQEVLVPWTVLRPTAELPGWQSTAFQQPTWWTGSKQVPASESALDLKPVTRDQELPLFAASRERDVFDELLQSPVLANQREVAGRVQIDDDRLVAFCRALDSHGGSMLRSALASAMQMPQVRLKGLISSMQRLLNVEGYAVITYDATSDTVRLDMNLLKTQFELDDGHQ